MAVTSNWEWTQIQRTTQQSYVGTLLFKKRVWSLERKRTSNDTFSSLIDTTATSLSAYNGGVTETISCPTTNYVTFTSISADCNFAKTGDKWVETGFYQNGYPTYSPYNASISPLIDGSGSNILVYYLCLKRLTSSTNFCWGVTFALDVHAKAGAYIQTWTDESTEVRETTGAASARDTNGRVLDYVDSQTYYMGNFVGSATTALTTAGTLGFYCTEDKQNYNTPSVDWFTQVQTWEYNEPWRVQ